MKRREKKLSVMDWVLVGLLDTLAGVVEIGRASCRERV